MTKKKTEKENIGEIALDRNTKFTKILKELEKNREGKNPKNKKAKGGRPIELTFETYSQIIVSLEYGLNENQVITSGIIPSKRFYEYKAHSDTFRSEIERAKQSTSVSAIMHIAGKIHGKPERVAKIYDRGKEVLHTIPAVEPDTELAKWWLVRKERAEFGQPTKDGAMPVAPNLGAPRTEREKELSLELLKMYHDYAKSKESENDESEE